MAVCDGVEHINIDNSLPENPLSPWEQIKPLEHCSSFAEILTESRHFRRNSRNNIHNSSESSFSCSPISSNSMFSSDANAKRGENGSFSSSYCCPYGRKKQCGHSDSFSSVNSDNLSICTEGLGFESFDDVDDLLKSEIFGNNNNNGDCKLEDERKTRSSNRDENHVGDPRSRTCCVGGFPPPISSIGKNGKPFVTFVSFRKDGRFILKEIKIPELLHTCRENGRLKLQFIMSDDDDDDDDDDDGDILDDGEKDEAVI